MRLSTSWMYQQSLASMMNQQSSLAATQNQVSTGKRINVASDDPAGAGRVISLNHILAANTQYTANIDAVSTRLDTAQSTLNAVNDLYNSARDLTLQALNGSLADSDRQAIATQLTQMRDQLLQMANTTDATGQALFAGTSSNTVPFLKNADGSVSYAGNDGQPRASIGAGLTVPTGESGSAIFMDVAAGNGRFVASAAAGNTGTLVVGENAVSDPTTFAAPAAADSRISLPTACLTRHAPVTWSGCTCVSSVATGRRPSSRSSARSRSTCSTSISGTVCGMPSPRAARRPTTRLPRPVPRSPAS